VNWKAFSSRILLIAVAFPVLGALIFLVPQLHHLLFNAAVAAACVIGALETRGLFEARGAAPMKVLAPLLAGTIPASSWLEVAGLIPAGWAHAWLAACMGIILVRAVFQRDPRRVTEFLSLLSSSLFVLLYPAYFMSWIVRFSALSQPSLSIVLFLGLVFGNDMLAYFAGSLWGGSTRLNLAISPQKTLVGFIAGVVGTGIIYTFFRLVFPTLLPAGILQGVGFTLVIGLAVILGDLVESGLKRSASVKDSGIIIPGRGGLLDSVDSMLLSAPLFYGLMRWAGQ
jgi:phosphatidate cytidylyltransferase